MKHNDQFWQQFTKSGDPKMYLAYKQGRQEDEPKTRHGNR